MHELCLEGMVKSVRCRLYNWQRYPTCRANGQIRVVGVASLRQPLIKPVAEFDHPDSVPLGQDSLSTARLSRRAHLILSLEYTA